MTKWARALPLISLGLLLTLSACLPGSSSSAISKNVKVIRGDLTVTVSGNGNLRAANNLKLSFGGTGGKIDKIYVKKGQEVSKGQAVAKLDTSMLELTISQGQVALNQARLAVTQADLAVKIAEYDLSVTREKKAGLDLALFNAQINLRTSQYNLGKATDTYHWPELQESKTKVDAAKEYLTYATESYSKSSGNMALIWAAAISRAKADLDAAEAKLKAQIQDYDPEEVAIKKMQVDSAQMAVDQTQKNLNQYNNELSLRQSQINSTKAAVDQAKQSVDLAQKSLDQSQKTLNDATLKAPFDGVMAEVSVDEGDTVLPQTPVVHLVDTNNMELIIELDEIDIPKVKVNQSVTVTLDALPGEKFNGKVVSIYPLPKNVSGVVLYDAKIGIEPSADIKVGMSASADIIVSQKSNILLLPNRAIHEDAQGNKTVKVQIGTLVEERKVTVGISDDTLTEISGGLNEGDVVVAG